MLSIDLHLHTTYSDGKIPLPKLIDFCGQAGLDAIAVTDHLCTETSFLGKSARLLNISLTFAKWKLYQAELEKERNRAWREYKMLVYTGAEYTHNTFNHKRNAHILAIDLPEFIPGTLTEEEWARQAKDMGALTVAAHPLKLPDASSQTYYLLDNVEKFNDVIDVWEAANARTLWRRMLRTPFSLMASSDLHAFGRWPSWRTQIDCDKDPDAIKAFLKNKENPRDLVFMFGKVSEIKHRVTVKPGAFPLSHDPFTKGDRHDSYLPRPLGNPRWAPSYP